MDREETILQEANNGRPVTRLATKGSCNDEVFIAILGHTQR